MTQRSTQRSTGLNSPVDTSIERRIPPNWIVAVLKGHIARRIIRGIDAIALHHLLTLGDLLISSVDSHRTYDLSHPDAVCDRVYSPTKVHALGAHLRESVSAGWPSQTMSAGTYEVIDRLDHGDYSHSSGLMIMAGEIRVHKLVPPFPIITLFKLIGSLPSLTSWVFWSYTALANRGG